MSYIMSSNHQRGRHFLLSKNKTEGVYNISSGYNTFPFVEYEKVYVGDKSIWKICAPSKTFFLRLHTLNNVLVWEVLRKIIGKVFDITFCV